jgi:hypothetical protein
VDHILSRDVIAHPFRGPKRPCQVIPHIHGGRSRPSPGMTYDQKLHSSSFHNEGIPHCFTVGHTSLFHGGPYLIVSRPRSARRRCLAFLHVNSLPSNVWRRGWLRAALGGNESTCHMSKYLCECCFMCLIGSSSWSSLLFQKTGQEEAQLGNILCDDHIPTTCWPFKSRVTESCYFHKWEKHKKQNFLR